jgi:hypothetical protein
MTTRQVTEGKVWEKPDNGEFQAVLVDLVLYKDVVSQYGKTDKLQVIWLLNAKDSEGNFFRVTKTIYNPVVSKVPGRKPSKMYQLIEDVLGEPPVGTFDDETLIGRSNNLLIIRGKDPVTGKVYANVTGIGPLKTGQTPLAIPAGFVRAKDKPTQTSVYQPRQAQAVAVGDEQF